MAQLGTDVAILASGSVVLTALVVLIRAVFRVAFTIRDNTAATALLTGRLDSLAVRLDHDFEKLTARVTALEKRRPRLDWACPGTPPWDWCSFVPVGAHPAPPASRSPDERQRAGPLTSLGRPPPVLGLGVGATLPRAAVQPRFRVAPDPVAAAPQPAAAVPAFPGQQGYGPHSRPPSSCAVRLDISLTTP